MSQQEREAAELDEARRQEAERQAKRDAEIEASWQKRILVEGTGAQAYRGAQARLHVVGRAHVDQHVTGRAAERGFVSGSIFEDSRARDCPLLLLLGRGLLVPGLDRCVLGMRVGERAEVTIAPEGGYGAAGSVANPMVPGSATLTYDVELLTVEKEIELWDMSFEDKMRLAAERKQRGNTLVSGGHLLIADAEYEQAMRYLVFMPHPEPSQVPLIDEAMLAVNLNLAATKLRLGQEEKAIKHASDVLAKHPDHTKAHYRLAQAYTQLGKVAHAQAHLEHAERCAEGDDASLAGIRKERERLQRMRDKRDRDRKRAAERMGVSRQNSAFALESARRPQRRGSILFDLRGSGGNSPDASRSPSPPPTPRSALRTDRGPTLGAAAAVGSTADTIVSLRLRGVDPPLPGVWIGTGGYSYRDFNSPPANDPTTQAPKRVDCHAWPRLAAGDQRLRQLRWLASASVDMSRDPEPSAHELKILTADRKAVVHTHAAFPRAMRREAVRVAKDVLEGEACVEFQIADKLTRHFDEAHGPEWRCFVGRVVAYARPCVRGKGHQHINFTIGQLQFLLFRAPSDGIFMYELKQSVVSIY